MTDSQGVSGTEGGYPVGSRRLSVLKPLLRTIVGVAIIALLVVRSDLDAMSEALADADPIPIAFALLLMVALLAVSALRWGVFLRSLGVELGTGTIMRLTFVGAFFNAFLPTGVGGDAYKAVRVRATGVSLSKTLASVLLDRIAGIVALAVVGLAAIAVLATDENAGAVIPVSALVSVGILAAAALLIGFGEKLLGSGQATWFGLRPRLQRTARALSDAGTHPHAVRWGLLGGLAAQVLGIAAHFALARALSLDVSLAALTLGVLLATVAATAPVTINGLGIREGVWVWALGVYGVGGGEALAYALLVLAMSLASSALGGVVYAVAGGDVVPATTRARS